MTCAMELLQDPIQRAKLSLVGVTQEAWEAIHTGLKNKCVQGDLLHSACESVIRISLHFIQGLERSMEVISFSGICNLQTLTEAITWGG